MLSAAQFKGQKLIKNKNNNIDYNRHYNHRHHNHLYFIDLFPPLWCFCFQHYELCFQGNTPGNILQVTRCRSQCWLAALVRVDAMRFSQLQCQVSRLDAATWLSVFFLVMRATLTNQPEERLRFHGLRLDQPLFGFWSMWATIRQTAPANDTAVRQIAGTASGRELAQFARAKAALGTLFSLLIFSSK